jgi:hypothetical protein
MKHKKAKLSAVLLFWLGLTGLQAQAVVSATGGNASGIGGSVNYSVGQVFYTTNRGTNGSEAQGVQQAYEITDLTGIETPSEITLKYTAFPNPTTNFLKLKVGGLKMENLFYQLYDMSGKLLEYKMVKDNETIISMSQLVPATYFLKVIQNTKEVKSFKIIKN